jgi:hypothetical protein
VGCRLLWRLFDVIRTLSSECFRDLKLEGKRIDIFAKRAMAQEGHDWEEERNGKATEGRS